MITLLRRAEVESLVGLGRSRIHKLESEGRFPQRVRLGDRAVAWRSDEIQQWIESRPRAQDAPAKGGIEDRLQEQGA